MTSLLFVYFVSFVVTLFPSGLTGCDERGINARPDKDVDSEQGGRECPRFLPAAEVLRTYSDKKDGARPSCVCAGPSPSPTSIAPLGPAGRREHGRPATATFRLQRPPPGGKASRRALLWDRTSLSWVSLSCMQLLTSAFAPLMAALGADLWSLLDQPVPTAQRVRPTGWREALSCERPLSCATMPGRLTSHVAAGGTSRDGHAAFGRP